MTSLVPTRAQARSNVEAFCKDVGADFSVKRDGKSDFDEGIWFYKLRCKKSGMKVSVGMLGLPLDQVRWTEATPALFPRIYVDGNTWLWEYGVGLVQEWIVERGVKLKKTRLRAKRSA